MRVTGLLSDDTTLGLHVSMMDLSDTASVGLSGMSESAVHVVSIMSAVNWDSVSGCIWSQRNSIYLRKKSHMK